MLIISDQIRPEAEKALSDLKTLGIRETVMLTGDTSSSAKPVAQKLGIDRVFAGLLPGDKVSHIETLLDVDGKKTLAFVGDGMNDAPVLTRADVGIAMGAMGQDAAIEAADVVLMDDDLSRLPQAIRIAKKTMAIVRQNIIFALAVKALVLLLGAFGYANMWLAVFADVGVSVLAIVNAMRALSIQE
ncbi:MAG: HAD-IC family P-type ATPase [Clostridia bacterium]|nr:HAD-IC family P-type ATPase [Clostridia bacterium]